MIMTLGCPVWTVPQATIKQDEDQDAKEIAKSLFAGLAKIPECKAHIEAALRASMAAATPEATSS